MYNKWVQYDGKGKWYYEEHPLDEVYKLTPEEEKEFERIKPVVKKLENAMTEEMRIDGQNKAINFKGLTDPLIYNGIQDFWYYVYTISNYRIHAIEMPKSNPFEGQQDEELFFFALTNVVVKSHKIHRHFNQRFV